MVTRDALLERDPDELERDLIAHGRRERAPDAARRRTLASVTIAGATGAALTTASISSSAAAVSGVAPLIIVTKWIAVGVAAGAVTLGVADRFQHRAIAVRRQAWVPIVAPAVVATSSVHLPTPPSSSVDVPLHAAETVVDPRRDPPALPQSARAPAGSDEPSKSPGAVSSPPAFREVSAPTTESLEESSLAREVRLLEQAHDALDAHAAARALAALDRYAEDFPAGHMAIEASALRIEALRLMGHRDAARALAQAFLAKYPSSPAAMRVARLLHAIDLESVP